MGDMIKEFTIQGNSKLDMQFTGTKKAIETIAKEKVKKFIMIGDIGLNKYETELLIDLIAKGMMQSFSLGYGVGKAEGLTKKQIYL